MKLNRTFWYSFLPMLLLGLASPIMYFLVLIFIVGRMLLRARRTQGAQGL